MYNQISTIASLFKHNNKSIIVSLGYLETGTQLDIAFSLVTKVNKTRGLYQRGVETQSRSLVVSVMGYNSFCFSLDGPNTSLLYVAEKLKLLEGETGTYFAEAIAVIINQIKNEG